MNEITVQELKAIIDSKEDFQLIDVREDHEVEAANIKGEHIPMGSVMDHLDRIAKDKKVIIHCRSGARSGSVVQALNANFGYTNLYNLKGGIMAWAREIDPSLSVA
jgi:sulfur-carrier protein adenylyltransferase/sulfurtransferase